MCTVDESAGIILKLLSFFIVQKLSNEILKHNIYKDN